MRTLIIIAIGIGLAALLLTLFKRDARTRRTVFITFVVAWVAVCAYNMWVGVSSAGYAVTEELPFLAINFLVPAAVVFALRKRIGRSAP